MNAMTFAFREKAMHVEMIDGEPWWVASQLCGMLDLENVTAAVKRLPDDMVALISIKGIGRGGPVNCVSEPGMWLLVARSDKAEAQEVILWLCRDVLPALRKYGFYQMPGFEPPPPMPLDLDPQRLAVGVNVVREARRLFGLVAARGMWAQVGLPPCVVDTEGNFMGDELAVPLKEWLAHRGECTIAEAAQGIGLGIVDHPTRHRIGQLLRQWGWNPKTCTVDGRSMWVFRRPPSAPLTVDLEA